MKQTFAFACEASAAVVLRLLPDSVLRWLPTALIMMVAATWSASPRTSATAFPSSSTRLNANQAVIPFESNHRTDGRVRCVHCENVRRHVMHCCQPATEPEHRHATLCCLSNDRRTDIRSARDGQRRRDSVALDTPPHPDRAGGDSLGTEQLVSDRARTAHEPWLGADRMSGAPVESVALARTCAANRSTSRSSALPSQSTGQPCQRRNWPLTNTAFSWSRPASRTNSQLKSHEGFISGTSRSTSRKSAACPTAIFPVTLVKPAALAPPADAWSSHVQPPPHDESPIARP